MAMRNASAMSLPATSRSMTKMQLFGLIDRGQILGVMNGRAFKDVAADGVDVEKEFLAAGPLRSGPGDTVCRRW